MNSRARRHSHCLDYSCQCVSLITYLRGPVILVHFMDGERIHNYYVRMWFYIKYQPCMYTDREHCSNIKHLSQTILSFKVNDTLSYLNFPRESLIETSFAAMNRAWFMCLCVHSIQRNWYPKRFKSVTINISIVWLTLVLHFVLNMVINWKYQCICNSYMFDPQIFKPEID